MEPSFAKLLARLANHGVHFLVVGGVAVTLQGYVRLTETVDLLIDGDPSNVRRLLACLADYGEGHARELSPENFDDSEGAIRIVEESEQCQIDLFTRMSGLQYRDVIGDADHLALSGHAIPYASKASLIRWKEASVREKDRLDDLALRRLQQDPAAFA